MREITDGEALMEAFREEMRRDEKVFHPGFPRSNHLSWI